MLTWIPIVISFLALGLSGYEFYSNRQRIHALDTPLIKFEENSDTDDPLVGIRVVNVGSAIAILKKVTYYVDRKPLDNGADVIEAGNLEDIGYYQFDDNDALAVGESEWMLSMTTKGKGFERKKIDHFLEFIDKHVAIGADVCSVTTGKCETECSTDGWCK
jgi:hypothetical protein